MTGTPHSPERKRHFLSLALLATLLVAGSGLLTFSVAAAQKDAADSQEGESKMGMMCPMMAGMKDLKLHADSPPLLAARAETLKLTEDQQQELDAIAQEARSQAQEVLTEQQREQLGDASKALSMMEIAKLRMKEKKSSDSSENMCPMCMKMMKEKMQDKSGSSNSDDRSN